MIVKWFLIVHLSVLSEGVWIERNLVREYQTDKQCSMGAETLWNYVEKTESKQIKEMRCCLYNQCFALPRYQ